MKLFEIKTLGSAFFFWMGKDADAARAPGRSVRVSVLDDFDFALSSCGFSDYYIPDLKRGFSAFLKYALGFPSSEYEVRTPDGSIRVSLPLGDFRTDVVSSDIRISPLALVGASAYRVRVAAVEYAVLPCENCLGANLPVLRREIISGEKENSTRAVVALSGGMDEYRVEALPLCDGLYAADSRALSACVCLLRSLGKCGARVKLSVSTGSVLCDVRSSRVVSISSSDVSVVRILT